MTEDDYKAFYSSDYHEKHQKEIGSAPYKERYDHDLLISKLRLTVYKKHLIPDAKILDIGCGNGAFIDAANEEGYQARGVDLNKHLAEKPEVFVGDLKEAKYDACEFNAITMHDVFEHLVDPVKYLDEVYRILKTTGMLIIDFPNYYVEAGKHHWRPVQHLWYFTEKEVISIMESKGFRVLYTDYPIPSKFVVYASKN